MNSQPPIEPATVYRFAGVELDPGNFALSVDGRPRACSRKAFELLLALCRNPQRVLSRNELTDALWPGGQIISDEALTQAIFRARSVIEPHAGLIRTVRGIGLRLDADVTIGERQPLPAVAPTDVAAEVVDDAPSVNPEPPAAAKRPRVHPWLLVALACGLALLALAAWIRSTPAPLEVAAEVLDEGYGLMLSDLGAGSPDTLRLVREALRHESSGERARAMVLLEAVHQSDAQTPIPAIYLAVWHGGQGQFEEARRWREQARLRIRDPRDLYWNVLLAYVEAETLGNADQAIHTAGALLDLRPSAWRLHRARAHLMEARGMREAALREIQQIAVPALGNRKRDLVIADRASMGDVAGAAAMLAALPPDREPATHAFLAGRVAWSGGEFEAALGHFTRAADLALSAARLDLHTRSLIYAGTIDAAFGRDQAAIATLERARSANAGNDLRFDVDLSLFLAQLHAASGDDARARQALERALSDPALRGTLPVAAQMVAWRLYPELAAAPADWLSPERQALSLAMAAWRQGSEAEARRELANALQRGVLSGRLADDARWLEWRLGLPVSTEEVLDPPYPPLSRTMVRREIRRALAQSDASVPPMRP